MVGFFFNTEGNSKELCFFKQFFCLYNVLELREKATISPFPPRTHRRIPICKRHWWHWFARWNLSNSLDYMAWNIFFPLHTQTQDKSSANAGFNLHFSNSVLFLCHRFQLTLLSQWTLFTVRALRQFSKHENPCGCNANKSDYKVIVNIFVLHSVMYFCVFVVYVCTLCVDVSCWLCDMFFRICVMWMILVMNSHPDTALNGSSCF